MGGKECGGVPAELTLHEVHEEDLSLVHDPSAFEIALLPDEDGLEDPAGEERAQLVLDWGAGLGPESGRGAVVFAQPQVAHASVPRALCHVCSK